MLSLLSAGSNAQGQLGNGTVDDSHSFQACSFAGAEPGNLPPNTVRVLSIATGSNHTLALLELEAAGGERSREVWGCGDGRKGQLGLDYQRRFTDQASRTVFQRLTFREDFTKLGLSGCTITAVGATWETSYLALSQPYGHDVVLSFGSNEFGDLGIGGDSSDGMVAKTTNVHAVGFSHIVIDGEHLGVAQKVAIDRIRTGQRHVIVSLKVVWPDKGPIQALVGWGASRHGQLDGSPTRQPQNPGLKTKERGAATYLQPTYYSRPILIMSASMQSDIVVEYSLGIHHSVFLHSSGRVSFRGSNRKNQLKGLDYLRNVRDVKCTWNGTYLLTNDNPSRILSVGSNTHGQLGRQEASHTLEIEGISAAGGTVGIDNLACGSEHCLVYSRADGPEGGVWGWGWNEHGNLGIGNTVDSPTPIKVFPPSQRPGNIEVSPIHGIWGGTGSSWVVCG